MLLALCCNYCSAVALVGFSFRIGANKADDSMGGVGLTDFPEACRVVESVLHVMTALKVSGARAELVEGQDGREDGGASGDDELHDSAPGQKRARKTSPGGEARGKTSRISRVQMNNVSDKCMESAAPSLPLCKVAIDAWRAMSRRLESGASLRDKTYSSSIPGEEERTTFISSGKGIFLGGCEVRRACVWRWGNEIGWMGRAVGC